MEKFELSTEYRERLTFNTDGTAEIIRCSKYSGKFHKVTMKMNEEHYYAWRNGGELIQKALPYLDKDEREFLMTGLTPEEWDELFNNT